VRKLLKVSVRILVIMPLTVDNFVDALHTVANFGVLSLEKNFRHEAPVQFAGENWHLVISIVLAYVCFCLVGQKVMAKTTAFDLRFPLAVWNAFLSLFSFIGMLRTVPVLLAFIVTKTYKETVCTAATQMYTDGAVGFWVCLFIFSKIPELIDTVFIVLRKRPLIFLHWYHHVTVLLYCWHAYSTLAGSGLYFVAMNYSVHAMMYGYFCLQALNICPKSFPSYLITLAQIIQMFVGTGVCASTWYFIYYENSDCATNFENLVSATIMYGSYLYLFAQFAVGRFLTKKTKTKKL